MLKRIFNRTTERELGFGNAVSTLIGERSMNPDGSMNVDRVCNHYANNAYYYMVTMPWGLFMLGVLVVYILINAAFAGLYCLVGVEHLAGIEPGTAGHNFMEAYFFSTQTLTTVGYGRVAPQGIPANLLASLESLLGLLSFALISGLLYGRFSRPKAYINFSEKMLVSPYKNGRALMFRMANTSKSELIEAEAQLILALNQTDEAGNITRRYHQLELEVKKISFMSLSWTIVHAIDEKSPLHGFSEKDMADANIEILVLIKAVEESYEQTVHARRSYNFSEIVWDARFSPIISRSENGRARVETRRVSDFQFLNV